MLTSTTIAMKQVSVFFCLIALTSCTSVFGQGGMVTGPDYELPPLLPEEQPFRPSLSAGLSIGPTSLPGVDVAFAPVAWASFKLSYSILAFKLNDYIFDAADYNLGEFRIGISPEVRLSSLFMLGEIAPFKGRRIRLVAGAGLGLNEFLSVRFDAVDPMMVNDLEITPEEIGYLKVSYTTVSPVNTYLGIGIGRTIPKRRINLSFDAGAFYRSAPRITIESTNLLGDNEHNGPILEENFKDWRWLPTMNLRMGVRLF